MTLRGRKGNIITNPEGIKRICLEEVLKRVRNRKIHPRLLDLQNLKEELRAKRLILATQRQSAPWTLKHLENVLKLLKKKKCRNHQGNVNELFRYEAVGSDLKIFILYMMNRTKEKLEIPPNMMDVNVVTIPKPKK